MVSGVGSMSDGARESSIQDFKNNSLDVLVCSNAAEEGIGIASCSFVIRFDEFDTTKSHIQGSGRARWIHAQIFYFGNEPEEEERNRRKLEQCAREEKCKEETREGMERVKHKYVKLEKDKVHPWRRDGDSGEINVLIAKKIVMEYCQKVMHQQILGAHLLRYEEQVINRTTTRRLLKECQVPSPQGWLDVSLEDVNKHWGGVCVEDVLDAEQMKNRSRKELEESRFYYVAAIKLSEQQYLDKGNGASPVAIRDTQHKCNPLPVQDAMTIRNIFTSSPAKRRRLMSHDTENDVGNPVSHPEEVVLGLLDAGDGFDMEVEVPSKMATTHI